MYVLEEALHVLADHKSEFKIDEFIDKLLTSQKFDKLAEKFAEKAAEKFLDLQPKTRITDDEIQKHVTQKDKTQKDELQKHEIQEKRSKNVLSNETDAQFKRLATPIKYLSLKYKHFTKSTSYNENSNEDKEDSKIKKHDESSFDTSTDTQNKSDDETKEKINSESSDQNKVENSEDSEKLYTHKILEKTKYETINAQKYSKEKDGSISMENKKNILEMLIESSSGDHKSNANIHQSNEHSSEFDTKLKKDREFFDNASQDILKSTQSKKKHKKRIHNEGNRLYTFLSSSDYDEYHQELDKVERERKVFN